jgi:site-specific DNA-methyltransferase (adenine-specific)
MLKLNEITNWKQMIGEVVNADCLQAMKLIPDKSIDICLTDPPYGTTACKWDSIIPLEPMWEQLKRIIKDNGAIALFGSEPFSSNLRMSNIKNYKYDWIWEKTKQTGFQNAKKMPMRKTENISVFYLKPPTYNPQGLIKLDKPIKSGRKRLRNEHKLGVAGNENHYTTHTNYPNNLILFPNPSGRGHLHPTQKPLALMEYLIKTYSNNDDLVLDFTCGSGTTCLAAKNLGRRFIGIELEERYCQISEERLKQEVLNL